MIYVTHDQIEAMTLADRIAIMKGGNILQLASPKEIYNRPANKYVAEFIGSPTMNFFEGEIDGNRFQTGDAAFDMEGYSWQGAATNGPAWLGIRPEHISYGPEASTRQIRLQAQVAFVEPLGSDTLVRVTAMGRNLWIRMDGQADVSNGDALLIGFDAALVNLFDKSSEARI